MHYVATKLQKDIHVDELFTVHYFEYRKDYRFAGEAHDFWECVYIDRGEAIISAGDEEFALTRGEIYFHQPNEWHTLRANGAVAPNIVVLSFSTSSSLMQAFCGFRTTVNNRAKSLIAAIIRESETVFVTPLGDPMLSQMIKRESAPVGAEQLIAAYLEELLILLLRAEGERPKTPIRYRAEGDLCDTLIAYMQKNLDKNLTLADLSRYAGVSESTVKAAFHDHIGQGALAYFIGMKMAAAKVYIREGDYNLTQIADRLGYNSIHYFSRRFRLLYGMSPTEYARSIKAIGED